MTDSSAALSSGELPGHVPVDCGTLHGVLFHHRLENGRSLCITVGKSKDFISPCEFERCDGIAATRNWKKSIQYKKQPIGDFLQDCVSSTTGKCCCHFALSGSLSSNVSPPVACLYLYQSNTHSIQLMIIHSTFHFPCSLLAIVH